MKSRIVEQNIGQPSNTNCGESQNLGLNSNRLTDWEHGPPPKIIVSDFNFFSKLGKIGLKKMLGGVGFPHWTFFSPGASFSQWTFQ